MRLSVISVFLSFVLLATAHAAQVDSITLKTVTIRGSFAEWPDANHYKGWLVYVIKPGDYTEEEEKKAERFPVSSDGSFKIVIHDAPIGDGYYLTCDHTGSQRFAVNSAKVLVGTISPDSAE